LSDFEVERPSKGGLKSALTADAVDSTLTADIW
jgi:hypothetical protein